MLYVDYHFDMEDGYLKFDEELHISSQPKFGNKKIKAEMLDEFLSLGYSKGRKMVVN